MDQSSISLVGLYQTTTLTPSKLLTPQERAEQSRLIQAVKSLNQSGIFGSSDELTFSFDQASRRPVIQLINRDTKEVLRTIPPEYVLRLSEDAQRALR